MIRPIPISSDASSIVTLTSVLANSRAADIPVIPPPITTTELGLFPLC